MRHFRKDSYCVEINRGVVMRTEGNVSKVAVCNNCNGFVLACHVDFLDKKVEREFTQFTNEGFDVKVETVEETRARNYSSYQDCSIRNCKKPTS